MAVKWYELKNISKTKVVNPSFEQSDGKWYVCGYRVPKDEFNRVLAEWESDQQTHGEQVVESLEEFKDAVEPHWVPKVGDWVKTETGIVTQVRGIGKNCAQIPAVGEAPEWWILSAIEPATPQPIDKLGWWLIDGECECFIIRDGEWIESENNAINTNDIRQHGIFLAAITDEELVAYHRNRIVPKCPVEVQS